MRCTRHLHECGWLPQSQIQGGVLFGVRCAYENYVVTTYEGAIAHVSRSFLSTPCRRPFASCFTAAPTSTRVGVRTRAPHIHRGEARTHGPHTAGRRMRHGRRPRALRWTLFKRLLPEPREPGFPIVYDVSKSIHALHTPDRSPVTARTALAAHTDLRQRHRHAESCETRVRVWVGCFVSLLFFTAPPARRERRTRNC